MRLRAKVAALERRAPRPESCPRCGPPARYVLAFDEPGRRDDRPERCPACGRQIEYRLEFDRSG